MADELLSALKMVLQEAIFVLEMCMLVMVIAAFSAVIFMEIHCRYSVSSAAKRFYIRNVVFSLFTTTVAAFMIYSIMTNDLLLRSASHYMEINEFSKSGVSHPSKEIIEMDEFAEEIYCETKMSLPIFTSKFPTVVRILQEMGVDVLEHEPHGTWLDLKMVFHNESTSDGANIYNLTAQGSLQGSNISDKKVFDINKQVKMVGAPTERPLSNYIITSVLIILVTEVLPRCLPAQFSFDLPGFHVTVTRTIEPEEDNDGNGPANALENENGPENALDPLEDFDVVL